MFFRSRNLKNNLALKVLLVTNGVILLAGGMLGPIYALFVDQIGGSLLDASFAGAVFAFADGCTILISGRFSDKKKYAKAIMTAGYLIISIGFFSLFFVTSIIGLLVVQVIIGLGEALYVPAFDGLFTRNLDKGKEASEWGVWEAMFNFIMAIAAVIGGYIVTVGGFDALFVLMGGLTLITAVYLQFIPRKTFK